MAVLAVCGLSGAAQAHPHVFIDADVEIIFDAAGAATALRITWIYDDLYSMLVIGERGLDPDFDGRLTSSEQAALSGFDMKWDANFAGDTYALKGDVPLALSRPEEWTADFSEGRLRSTHLRRLSQAVEMGDTPLVVQVYDPSYYTAYRIAANPVLTGAPVSCKAEVFVPDQAAANAILEAALEEYSGSDGVEADFPAIGAAYAEEARITCAKPS